MSEEKTDNGTQEGTESKTTSRSTRSRKKPSSASNGSGLVKAEKHDIIILEDHTRVFETDSLPNHRPITVSEMEVVGTLGGGRPIMANSFEISTTDTLPGHRPVAVSHLEISESGMLPGNRPIASNDIDEAPTELMGYLD
ncbi:MAG: hypothetical protein AAFY78_03710 [Cyanobacteria bacterium J06648_16]